MPAWLLSASCRCNSPAQKGRSRGSPVELTTHRENTHLNQPLVVDIDLTIAAKIADVDYGERVGWQPESSIRQEAPSEPLRLRFRAALRLQYQQTNELVLLCAERTCEHSVQLYCVIAP